MEILPREVVFHLGLYLSYQDREVLIKAIPRFDPVFRSSYAKKKYIFQEQIQLLDPRFGSAKMYYFPTHDKFEYCNIVSTSFCGKLHGSIYIEVKFFNLNVITLIHGQYYFGEMYGLWKRTNIHPNRNHKEDGEFKNDKCILERVYYPSDKCSICYYHPTYVHQVDVDVYGRVTNIIQPRVIVGEELI
jgi:hypothetical protein